MLCNWWKADYVFSVCQCIRLKDSQRHMNTRSSKHQKKNHIHTHEVLDFYDIYSEPLQTQLTLCAVIFKIQSDENAYLYMTQLLWNISIRFNRKQFLFIIYSHICSCFRWVIDFQRILSNWAVNLKISIGMHLSRWHLDKGEKFPRNSKSLIKSSQFEIFVQFLAVKVAFGQY